MISPRSLLGVPLALCFLAAACSSPRASPGFTLGFTLTPNIHSPCSQFTIPLHPGPHDGRHLPITISLRKPPPGISAASVVTNSDEETANLVGDLAYISGSFTVEAVGTSPGYPDVVLPLSLSVLCWPDEFCARCLPPDAGPPCTTDGDCTSWPSAPICDPVQHECRACGASSECAGNGNGRVLCQTMSSVNLDDTGQCVQCVEAADCTPQHQACDTRHGSCVACTKNEDCASGQCDAISGECADPSTIVYVGPHYFGDDCRPPGTGSLDEPFCTISDGLAYGASVGRKVVVWRGTYDENIVIVPAAGHSYKVSAVGVGMFAPEVGSLQHATSPVFDVTLGDAQSVDVALENFDIRYGSGGFRCQGGSTTSAAKIAVTRSYIYSGGIGVQAQGCDVTLDQDSITDNGSGVLLESSDFTLTNLLVAGNLSSGVIATGTSARATLTNSTIVDNRTTTGSSATAAVACVAGMRFANNVVIGNVGSAPEVDLATCAPEYSAFVGAGSAAHNQDLSSCGADAGAIEDVLFAAQHAYHPATGGNAPCTLVGLGTPVGAPATDIDGRPRPALPSIGCYEP